MRDGLRPYSSQARSLAAITLSAITGGLHAPPRRHRQLHGAVRAWATAAARAAESRRRSWCIRSARALTMAWAQWRALEAGARRRRGAGAGAGAEAGGAGGVGAGGAGERLLRTAHFQRLVLQQVGEQAAARRDAARAATALRRWRQRAASAFGLVLVLGRQGALLVAGRAARRTTLFKWRLTFERQLVV